MSGGDTFSFDTSWGARYAPEGSRFRLWAPSAKSVELAVAEVDSTEPDHFQPLTKSDDGWWETVATSIGPGMSYGYRLDGETLVADPAARAQSGDVHWLSRLVDPRAHQWRTADWKGRPWHECVFYELHVGTFTEEGTFDAIIPKLDYLRDVGITAIELLPVAQFGGQRGWGYDGVLLYCPHQVYGGPEGLKRLVDAAHERGLMVFLDVVYNHFGPDGNYIPSYIPEFFHQEISTPWGAAIAYDEKPVRDFMIENALYWMTEYRIDGLRLDAIDSIKDTTDTPLVKELAARVREVMSDRHVHITTEDDRNITWHIERGEDGSIPLVSGEWNDDFHHTAHVLATAEQESYYSDYTRETAAQMARSLATGFVFQGDMSKHRDREVGNPSAHLPPTAFVNFIQNHDQIGNRAFGDRLRSLSSARIYDCVQAILLLSPQIPLMFQGDEFGDCNSFCFFTDFDGELASAVSLGRRKEFRKFAAFEDEEAAEVFPDPNSERTFEISRIDWDLVTRPIQRRRLQVTTKLLKQRQDVLMPLLDGARGGCGKSLVDGLGFVVSWELQPGRVYHLFANLSDEAWTIPEGLDTARLSGAEIVYANHKQSHEELSAGRVPPMTVVFALADGQLFGGVQ
ncbi:malto-oligosyltrehalose trehalohydrolase [Aureimonas phyllosphaerae]|uniref:Malto-oligosyltrehalose trehalohydrolase n=1 Tax=Aureimonas phyllosphaerae TaxID=1166078 RepID=A0A7W6BUK6_9HYPH|nr:malto-oligosyltrehalose trehalohydrolase [Aureimonas phyllosphaerae]MBB3938303.1 malto-oligosyltrehalose trehalohydrolase [Aureimonas phyllosphaerae]MBB3962310.1 malto-oligosyltrehalose trehalohydrolase [Aureimonas phyllosphaerae]SFF59240.1 maltooligosyl trehalose hydrolase [Aureimonas phyllosphaerae]